MEALSRMINRAAEGGLIEGFGVGGRGVVGDRIYHLLFVDDTIIFCGADSKQLRNLRCGLLCFEAVSGLKINLRKSEIIAVGEVPDLDSLATNLGCKVGMLPSIYLGLPLGAKFKSKAMRDPIIERFQKRLNGWRKSYLSKGGKVTLIKSTLASLPTYFMSLFVLLGSVAARLEKFNETLCGKGWRGSIKCI